MHKISSVTGTLLAALAGLSAAPLAGAEAENGLYFGLAAGQSGYDAEAADLDDIVLGAFESQGLFVVEAESSLDDSDSAFAGLIGYRFGRHFAVEAAYYDLGALSYEADGLVSDGFFLYDATFDLDISPSGPALSALGIVPLSDSWEIYGRAGMFFADLDIDVGASIGGGAGSASDSASSQDALVGLGAAFRASERWTVRLEYQRFLDVGDEEDTGESDVDLVNLGFTFTI
jgi:OOP family OmpA-OmpF porin